MKKIGCVFSAILFLICACSALNWVGERITQSQKTEQAKVELQQKQVQAISDEAQGIKAQADAINQQAQTIGKLSDEVVQNSKDARKQAEQSNTLMGYALGGCVFLTLLIFILVGGRRVAG